MTTPKLTSKALAKVLAFDRLERFCRKFCAGAGRVDIIANGSAEGEDEVVFVIRGKYDDGDFSEEENYYGKDLLDCIDQMPK